MLARLLACSASCYHCNAVIAAERKQQQEVGSSREQEAEGSRRGTACHHRNAMIAAAAAQKQDTEGRKGKQERQEEEEDSRPGIPESHDPQVASCHEEVALLPCLFLPYLPCIHTLLACLLPNTW